MLFDRKHIAADLRPYTCLFEDCQIGDMLYVKKDAWEAHMNESHRSAPYGQCFACRETFNGPDIRNELEIHVKDAHRGIISDDQNQLSIAIEACMKTNPPSFAKCPLCHWVEEETLRMHLSDEHDYPNAFEDVSYWECVACAAAQCFQNKKDLENYCRHSHPGIDSEPISVLPSRNKQEYELQCSRCRAYRIFSSETELIEHANSLHEGITDEERLPEFVVMCGARYPQFDECCVICSLAIAQMPPPSHQFILDHIAEHIHSFALYSLPWTEKLDEEDSNSLVETDYFGEEDEESNRAWIEGAANDEVDLEDRDNDIIKSFSVQEIQSDLAKNFSIIAPNPDEIRIAIICALALEAVAVISLLDETYDWMSRTYKRSTGETTMTQTTGRVGNHHVVICLLPGMGVASTASVLNDLRKSYTGIELGLVVGICGASPYGYNQQEIILGDVTISKSVIQYHFGKQYPEGFWRKTDVTETLERRTREIRSFFAAMVTRNMQIKLEKQMKGHLVTLMNDPDGNWKYPGAGKDVLYESNYRHRHYNNDPTTAECICAQCLSKHDPICDDAMSSDCDKTKCSAENSVRRSRLRIDGDDYPSPVAHIGTLASTKTVVNSGEQRDTLAKKHGVIAFEAEGAVVWDTIPSIFIKGVCDYADCHKNKDWRNFAAATAAAYTKAILEYWEDKADSSILESSTPVTTSDEKSTPVSASGEASLPVVDLPKESRGNSSRSGL